FPLGLTPAKNPTGSEDCLYLNVWAPMTAAKAAKPVMVFIHGGGFVLGSGSQPWYESTNLASQGDVVAVTINYRLNAFGFIVHPALKDAKGRIGNYGLYDQAFALKWVKKNIAAFGGDPNNVTIFGESAGGMSVGLHLISPESRGMFTKAIIESGPMLLMKKTVAEEEKTGLEAAAELGCTDPATVADCLRAADPKKLMAKLHPFSAMMSDIEMTKGFAFNPVIDGFFIPDVPAKLMKKGDFAKNVKVMIGSNRDEATLFTMKKKLDTMEQLQAAFKDDSAKVRNAFGLDAFDDTLFSFYPVSAYSTPRAAYNALVTDAAFTCPSRTHANMIVSGQPDVYLYFFTKPLTDKGMLKDWGVFHGAELGFVFQNFNFLGMSAYSDDNLALSKKVIALWSSFARTGVPSAPGVPAWPRYNSKTAPFLKIDSEQTPEENFRMKECAYLEGKILKSFGN
ncbi:MAG TPA: carboxylesterase family protein, partial [bacterium]|nr:carboxylesterase family protein [bacterium]